MLKWSDLKSKIFGSADEENNLNEHARKQQFRIGLIAAASVIAGYFLISKLASNPEPVQHEEVKEETVADGVMTHDYSELNERSALEQSQLREDKMSNRLASMEDRLKSLVRSQDKLKKTSEKKIHDIEQMYKNRLDSISSNKLSTKAGMSVSSKSPVKKVDQVAKDPLIKSPPSPLSPAGSFSSMPHQATVHLSMSKFSYPMKGISHGSSRLMGASLYEPKRPLRTPKNYVPAGTFAKVVLLEGADANASVNGQSDTSGILLRILDRGTLPNGQKSRLKGCVVLASIYGDISSERGEARLTTISCVRHDRSIFERKVQGYLSFAGKEGVRGTPVMRNGKILAMAGLSGMLSGVGSALQEASQTQTVSPLGTTSVVSPSEEESVQKEEKTRKKMHESRVSKSSEEEVRRLLKQAQKSAQHQPNNSPFTNVN